MPNNILLSIIIVSYNCLQYLIDCLESIKNNNDIGNRLEIIVVDNSNNDETYLFLKNNYKEIIAIKNDNLGFGQGNNVGAKLSRGKYLFFLNPDTKLVNFPFSKVINCMEKRNVFCAGFQLLDGNNKRTNSFGLSETLGMKNVIFNKFLHATNIFIPSKMYVSGADILISRNVFFDAGLFDEHIFMYYEEVDLFTRLKKRKYNMYFLRRYKIVHLEGRSTYSSFFDKYKRQIESYKYVCDKHGIDFDKRILKEKKYIKIKFVIAKLLKKNEMKECYLKIYSWLNERF